jgi:hypothetical protein
MRNILPVLLTELKRRRTSLRPKALTGILFVLIIFALSFLLLSLSGLGQQRIYYTIDPAAPGLFAYFTDSSFLISRESNTVIFDAGDRYELRTTDDIVGSATRAALVNRLKEVNFNAFSHYNISPKYMLLLNVTERYREELLNRSPIADVARPAYGSGASLDDIPGPTDTDEKDVEQDKGSSSGGDDGGSSPSGASSSETEPPTGSVADTRTAPDTGSGAGASGIENEAMEEDSSQEQSISGLRAGEEGVVQSTQDEQGDEIHPDLLPATEVETFSHVKDMFIIIQFLLILNFMSAIFGNAIFEEKLSQRSSMLFMSNLRTHEFIIGKMLPYALIAMALMCILVAVQYPAMLLQPMAYVIMATLVILYFSFACLNGFLARSNKEYSFLNVFSISGISLYLLIPAFIANYSKLGYASLFTPLLFYAQEAAVDVSLLLFLLPIYLGVGLILFFVASRHWNYEDLYQYRPVKEKIYSMVEKSVKHLWHYLVAGVFVVPFAWMVQLLFIAVFLVVDLPFKTVLFMMLAAFTEDILKNIAPYATLRNARADSPSWRIGRLVAISLLTGGGFMVAEKLFLVLAIVPYLNGFELLVTAGLVVPFLLHAGLTFLYLLLMKHVVVARRRYVLFMLLSGIIHVSINLLILNVFQVKMI